MKPELIFVLGGHLTKENDHWRTTNFKEGDTHGISGDRLRIDAAQHLHRDDPTRIFVAAGNGKGEHGQLKDVADAPYLYEVLKRELVAAGIPEDQIIEEKDSNNTYQQLQAAKKLIGERQADQAMVISNIYHLPRIEAFIDIDPDLKKMAAVGMLVVTGAEDVLMEHEPDVWQDLIEEAYNSEAMSERIVLEQQGVRAIREGTYQINT